MKVKQAMELLAMKDPEADLYWDDCNYGPCEVKGVATKPYFDWSWKVDVDSKGVYLNEDEAITSEKEAT